MWHSHIFNLTSRWQMGRFCLHFCPDIKKDPCYWRLENKLENPACRNLRPGRHLSKARKLVIISASLSTVWSGAFLGCWSLCRTRAAYFTWWWAENQYFGFTSCIICIAGGLPISPRSIYMAVPTSSLWGVQRKRNSISLKKLGILAALERYLWYGCIWAIWAKSSGRIYVEF